MSKKNQAVNILKNSPDKMNSRSFGIDMSCFSKGSRLVLRVTAAFTAATTENQALSPVRGTVFKQDRSRTSLDSIRGKQFRRWGLIVNFVDPRLTWVHLEAAQGEAQLLRTKRPNCGIGFLESSWIDIDFDDTG